MGDYCSGTNHVLPTYGYARAYSGLSVLDFVKRITVQELSPAGPAQRWAHGRHAGEPGRTGRARERGRPRCVLRRSWAGGARIEA